MVERESESIYQEAQAYVARAGLKWADYLEQQNRTDDSVRAEYRAEAERRVKTTLLLEAIAKAEKIEATEADLESEITSLSRQYGQPRQAIVEMLRPNLASLIDGIVRSKTLDFLLDQAKIIELPAGTEATKTAPA
jgi:trigger factor